MVTTNPAMEDPLAVTAQTSRPAVLSTEGDLATRLRASIVNGDFSPLERLKFADLAKKYEAGFGTLREALSQLATEGYVTQETNKGFAVAPVSRDELLEITDHLIELEQRAIASAIAHGDDGWEAQIVAAHHKLNAIEKQPWEERVAQHSEWVKRHRDFHESLVAACHGPWLLRLRALMFDQLDRYRFLTKMTPIGSGKSRGSEHRKIMEAVLDRDVEEAAALIDTHIRKTTKRAVPILENLGT